MDLGTLYGMTLDQLNAIWRIAKNDGRGRPFKDAGKAARYIWNAAHRNGATVAEWHHQATTGKASVTIQQAASTSLDSLLSGDTLGNQAMAEQTREHGIQTHQNASQSVQVSQTSETINQEEQSNMEAQSAASKLEEAIRLIAQGGGVNADAVRAIVKQEIEAAKLPQIVLHTVEIRQPDGTLQTVSGVHKTYARVLARATLRLNIWLSGPAGSAKTHCAQSLARDLRLPFEFNSTLQMVYDVFGFVDAAGQFHETPFYRAFKNGGVYLADEADGWDANAFLALNSALANDIAIFANGEQVKKHPDFICVAAANTWGLGGNFDYVGRNKLDAATLDRFVMVAWDYDENLEIQICGNEAWARKVQGYRAKAFSKGLKVVISPRASIMGAKMLAAGIPESEVCEECIKKGMSADQWQSIQ